MSVPWLPAHCDPGRKPPSTSEFSPRGCCLRPGFWPRDWKRWLCPRGPLSPRGAFASAGPCGRLRPWPSPWQSLPAPPPGSLPSPQLGRLLSEPRPPPCALYVIFWSDYGLPGAVSSHGWGAGPNQHVPPATPHRSREPGAESQGALSSLRKR